MLKQTIIVGKAHDLIFYISTNDNWKWTLVLDPNGQLNIGTIKNIMSYEFIRQWVNRRPTCDTSALPYVYILPTQSKDNMYVYFKICKDSQRILYLHKCTS